MSQVFDPTGMSHLMPGQQPSQAQLRYMTMWKMVHEDFKAKDQYVVMTPFVGPEAIKCLSAEHAAQVVYDKQARLATEDEIQKYKTEDEQARHKIIKQVDKQDLAKAVQRIVRD